MRDKPLVLIIDDEDYFLEIASMSLKSDGLDTITTKDIKEALEKAEELLPDLILSDIYMPPGPNGWEFAMELKKNPKTKDIRIVFFTSLRDPWLELKQKKEEIVEALGEVTFLSKMDDVPMLAKRVKEFIAGRS